MDIYEVDMKATQSELQTMWDEVRDDVGAHSATMNISNVTSRMSSDLYKIEITTDNGNTASIIAEARPSDNMAIFKKQAFKSMGGKFYEVHLQDSDDVGTDNDSEYLMCLLLKKTALKTGGSVIFDKVFNGPVSIIDGKTYNCTPGVYCDAKKKIYTLAGDVDGNASDDPLSGFSVNKPLNKYVSENPDLKDEIKQLKTNEERTAYMGKYLIQKKLDGEMDSAEFKDLFMQAGLLGYTDKTCKMLYELLM